MTFNSRGLRAMQPLLGLMILLHAGLAQADDMDYLLHTTPSERAASQTHFIQSQLRLSADTTAQVQLINQKYAEKLEPVIKGSSNRISKILELKEIQQEKEAELQKVLTATQFDAYQNSKDALKAAMQRDLQH